MDACKIASVIIVVNKDVISDGSKKVIVHRVLYNLDWSTYICMLCCCCVQKHWGCILSHLKKMRGCTLTSLLQHQ